MAEPALCVHPVHKSRDESARADPTERCQTAVRQNWRSDGESQLGQREPMPAECGAFLLGDLARELIGRVQGCSDNERFLGGSSVL